MLELNVLIGPLFACVGVAACARTWWQGQKVTRSLAWPSVPGTITRSEVGTESQRNGGHVYVPRIEYDYEANGTRRHGATICVGGELNLSVRGPAEERCARYPVGARVEVYHDPQEPHLCCLERTREGAWLGYLVGNVFLVVGLLLVTGVIHLG